MTTEQTDLERAATSLLDLLRRACSNPSQRDAAVGYVEDMLEAAPAEHVRACAGLGGVDDERIRGIADGLRADALDLAGGDPDITTYGADDLRAVADELDQALTYEGTVRPQTTFEIWYRGYDGEKYRISDLPMTVGLDADMRRLWFDMVGVVKRQGGYDVRLVETRTQRVEHLLGGDEPDDGLGDS